MEGSAKALRKALRAQDPEGSGQLALEVFRQVVHSQGLDLLRPQVAQAVRECLDGESEKVDYENVVSLLRPPRPRRSGSGSAVDAVVAKGVHAGRGSVQQQRMSLVARQLSDAAATRYHTRASDEDKKAHGPAPQMWDASRPADASVGPHGYPLSQREAHGLVVRPAVRLVGLDKARARKILLGLVPSGSSREVLGMPHGLLTALRRLGVPDVFASAMRTEVESYGSTEVIIDDYLEFVTSFGSAKRDTADAMLEGADARPLPGMRASRVHILLALVCHLKRTIDVHGSRFSLFRCT
eukprot:COSAG02_NODE_10149_length_2009_cov_38.303141_2_plen_296_part_01